LKQHYINVFFIYNFEVLLLKINKKNTLKKYFIPQFQTQDHWFSSIARTNSIGCGCRARPKVTGLSSEARPNIGPSSAVRPKDMRLGLSEKPNAIKSGFAAKPIFFSQTFSPNLISFESSMTTRSKAIVLTVQPNPRILGLAWPPHPKHLKYSPYSSYLFYI
jgi:hypothetical protein